MSFLTWMVLGLISGFIASKIVNKSGEGPLIDIVLGIKIREVVPLPPQPGVARPSRALLYENIAIFRIDANCCVKRLILKESEAQTTAARRTQCASDVTRTRGDSPPCGTQFDPNIVEAFLSIPEVHWIELRESLDSPFRLTHSRNIGFVPQ
jgi:hypothetical protein